MSLKIRRISGCSISPASNSALVLRNATDIAPIATASAASIESSVGCVATPDDKGPGGEVKLPPGDFDWPIAWTAEGWGR